MSSFARATTALCCGVPVTVMPRPRRNSSRPSSRSSRRARRTVFVLTPRTAARSFAGGSLSPGFASPSAMARRISAATWWWSSVGSWRSILTGNMVPLILAQLDDGVALTVSSPSRGRDAATVPAPRLPSALREEALIEEARQRARRRRRRYGGCALLVAGAALTAFALGGRGG